MASTLEKTFANKFYAAQDTNMESQYGYFKFHKRLLFCWCNGSGTGMGVSTSQGDQRKKGQKIVYARLPTPCYTFGDYGQYEVKAAVPSFAQN